MMMIMSMTSITLMIASAMMTLASIISKKTNMDREKTSPFECGFDPMNSPRMPFSLHFFLIAVVFLIFDVEITLLIPIIQIMGISNMINYSTITVFFIMILLMGLYHEWNQGALNWTN